MKATIAIFATIFLSACSTAPSEQQLRFDRMNATLKSKPTTFETLKERKENLVTALQERKESHSAAEKTNKNTFFWVSITGVGVNAWGAAVQQVATSTSVVGAIAAAALTLGHFEAAQKDHERCSKMIDAADLKLQAISKSDALDSFIKDDLSKIYTECPAT